MKKVAFSILILCLVILSAYLVITMPYRFYYTFQREGVQSAYFLATDTNIRLFEGLTAYDQKSGETPFWKSVHIQNFKLDIPFKDVTFNLFPVPTILNRKTIANFDIVDHQLNRVVRAEIEDIEKFNNAIPMDELFGLPIMTKFIKGSTNQQVWLDVLNLNIRVKELDLLNYKNIRYLLDNYSISKLGYFLYIYKMRQKVFVSNATKIVQNGPFHIIQSFENEKSPYVEHFFYDKGRLYKVTFRYNKNHPDHIVILNKLAKNIRLKLSRDEESSLAMYNEFRHLKYQNRFDYKGMVLLYSAWSHEMENAAFYKEMIYYLEKGSYQTSQLFNLYDFAKKKFGKTFSGRDEILKNDLKAKIEMEAAKEAQKKERDLADYKIDGDVDFQNDDQKIDYILKNVDVKEKKDDLSEY